MTHFNMLIIFTLIAVFGLNACGGDNNWDGTSTMRTPQSIDFTAPVITILGDNPNTLLFGENYIEVGATAFDNIDGAIGVSISGQIKSSVSGIYTVNYTASDFTGNEAIETRTVIVEPEEPDTFLKHSKAQPLYYIASKTVEAIPRKPSFSRTIK